jgi:HPt (histidine-containing phosphotransfer) domain-containing protein
VSDLPPTANIDEEAFAQLSALRATGGAQIVHELVEVFLRDTGARLHALRAAARTRDASALRQVAHALKGSAGIMGARGLVTLCADLEVRAASAGLDDVDDALHGIEEEFERVSVWLARELGA